ncbi:hypothetical protein DACRYDRAFT_16663 [Dacryopinax primogenitus]|uniref:Uncharacterized protein n=1 Tax=Dacryopinax primogenitus (strain DJM 731) TaxID=1858805 RepID=M5G4G8_DACPD|nr:uncharacterized protein DACRYDRAFT_16663 [Dacryopinax primogenitus]EJU00712.1 hypothetical protein DACRYDRAFT_16663 [Dacryopinax primogenitus]
MGTIIGSHIQTLPQANNAEHQPTETSDDKDDDLAGDDESHGEYAETKDLCSIGVQSDLKDQAISGSLSSKRATLDIAAIHISGSIFTRLTPSQLYEVYQEEDPGEKANDSAVDDERPGRYADTSELFAIGGAHALEDDAMSEPPVQKTATLDGAAIRIPGKILVPRTPVSSQPSEDDAISDAVVPKTATLDGAAI